MQPWLRQEAEVDFTRRVVPYINPFPDAYVRLLPRDDYPPSRHRLIDDYLGAQPDAQPPARHAADPPRTSTPTA